ncbi:IS21 family transposase, partial [Dietzia sp. SLG310A2-38A2]|nr:IS21 family transposase [Dietzia sp. SLG310A2-38A2]
HVLLPETVVNEYRTNDADLPVGPKYRQWDQSRVREWAERVGPSALVVTDRIFESVPVVEQGMNPALAV